MFMFILSSRGRLALASLALVCSLGASAQQVGRPMERLGDVPAFGDQGGGVSVQSIVRQGKYVSIQVNTDANHNNILNDAANEPSITINPLNPKQILIGWRQFDNRSSNFRQAGYAYSEDGGSTWTAGKLTPGTFRSDPIVRSHPDGRFFYDSLKVVNDVYSQDIFRSSDGGKTWQNFVPAFGGDKQWLTIDNTNSIGRGNAYSAWSTTAGPNTFTRSTDGGNTWISPRPIPNTPVFGTLDVGPNGEVYVGGVTQPSFNISTFAVSRSSNARDKNQTPTFDVSKIINMGGSLIGQQPINPEGLSGQVNLVVDKSGGPRNGWVYLMCSVKRTNDPCDVMFARSQNGGSTWSTAIRVNDDPTGNNKYQWMAALGVAPNGRLDAVWFDTRNDSANNFSQLFYSYSNDGGATWSKNVAVGPKFNQSLGYPNQNKMGDYMDIQSDSQGAHVAYSATYNGEEDVYYLRIGPSQLGNPTPIQPQ